jgi:hypothetical protein
LHIKDFCLCVECIARIPDDAEQVPFHRRVGALEAIAALRRGGAFSRRRVVSSKVAPSN